MRLWDRLISRDVSSYWEGMASGAAQWTTSYGQTNRESLAPGQAGFALNANATSAIVFAAEAVRMALFAEARFQFQAKDDKHLFGNTTLAKLEEPFGPGSTEGDLLTRMEQDAGFMGQAYIWDPPGEDRLIRLRPDWTTIVSELITVDNGTSRPGFYRRKIGYWHEPPKTLLDQDRLKGFMVPASECVHWAPIPDPAADFRGMSWLTPAIRDVQGDTGLAAYKIKYLENAATPNLLIRYSQKLQPGTVDSIRERVTARYGGVSNAFKTLVLDQGADTTVVGNSLSQMDFSGVSAVGVERILADAMVPGVLVGLEPLRGAGRGYQESMQKLANLYARPQWRSVCGALSQLLDVPAGNRLWFDVTDIAALQDGELERGQAALVRAQALLTARQGNATFDSAVAFVDSGDVTKLQFDPKSVQPPGGNVQHLLPQPGQPGATAEPLPAGTQPRLPLGPSSPGGGGQGTRPVPQLAAGRRALLGSNGRGDL